MAAEWKPAGTFGGTQVQVLNDSDTLPTGLPKGSVVIVTSQSGLTFYTEDGKTA